MNVPRRLAKTKEHPPYEIVEWDDPRAAFLLCPEGALYPDAEAEALGITAYLAAYDQAHVPAEAPMAVPAAEPEAKMVEQAEVEDKAVDLESHETKTDEPPKGVIIPPETRRIGGKR